MKERKLLIEDTLNLARSVLQNAGSIDIGRHLGVVTVTFLVPIILLEKLKIG